MTKVPPEFNDTISNSLPSCDFVCNTIESRKHFLDQLVQELCDDSGEYFRQLVSINITLPQGDINPSAEQSILLPDISTQETESYSAPSLNPARQPPYLDDEMTLEFIINDL
ncbi:hypothetical protein BC936DRAFT_145817 [Jimgerdemannia flammicorona]|uniref:Uncharacterized protein n=1 Tax=Jimgerdemannia flammicorona TaxID=994334 RepID=A0A433D905_9FUNG|nr:hypothetical protein BC936DRAFT_145817 [Jimgerdemannia flammicorona]